MNEYTEDVLKIAELKNIGFKELPHFNVMNSLNYDLGRNRFISIGCLSTPNEIVFIGEIDEDNPKKINELIVLRNFDYDGYTTLEQIKTLIETITKNNKK